MSDRQGRTLYIHIGSHKTGTTSIQFTLAENAARLKKAGFTYFYQRPDGAPAFHPMFHSWLGWYPNTSIVPGGMRVLNPQLLSEKLSQTTGDVIISSENFSFFFLKKHIEELRNAVAPHFRHVKIIAYLRRQDRHTISHVREGAQFDRPPEEALWGHPMNILPVYTEQFDLYLDYAKRLGMWADVFGDESMVLRVFERATLLNGDMVDDFCALVGIPEYNKIPQMNISRSSDEGKFGHLILSGDYNHPEKLFELLDKLPLSKQTGLPAQRGARDFMGNYRESNIALNKRLNVTDQPALFDDAFDEYPEVSTQVWNQHDAWQFLKGMFGIYDKTFAEVSVAEFDQAAEVLDRSHPELARKMRHVARALEP